MCSSGEHKVRFLLISSGGIPPCATLLEKIKHSDKLKEKEKCSFEIFAIRNFLTKNEETKFDVQEFDYLHFRLASLCQVKTVGPEQTKSDKAVQRMCVAFTNNMAVKIVLPVLFNIINKRACELELSLWPGWGMLDDANFYQAVICLKPLLEMATIEDRSWYKKQSNQPMFHRVDPPKNKKKQIKTDNPPFLAVLSKRNFQSLTDLLLMPYVFFKIFRNLCQIYSTKGIDPDLAASVGYSFENMFYLELLFRSWCGVNMGHKFIFDETNDAPGPDGPMRIIERSEYHPCTLLHQDFREKRHLEEAPKMEDGKDKMEDEEDEEDEEDKMEDGEDEEDGEDGEDEEDEEKVKKNILRWPDCENCNYGNSSHKVCYSFMTNIVQPNYPVWDYMHIQTQHVKKKHRWQIEVKELQLVQITTAKALVKSHPIEKMQNDAKVLIKLTGVEPSNVYIIYYTNHTSRETSIPPNTISVDNGKDEEDEEKVKKKDGKYVWCLKLEAEPKAFLLYEVDKSMNLFAAPQGGKTVSV